MPNKVLTKADLDALPDGAVVLDGSGLAKQKNQGKWKAWFDRFGSSSKRMLDPGAVRQPLTVIHVPS